MLLEFLKTTFCRLLRISLKDEYAFDVTFVDNGQFKERVRFGYDADEVCANLMKEYPGCVIHKIEKPIKL